VTKKQYTIVGVPQQKIRPTLSIQMYSPAMIKTY